MADLSVNKSESSGVHEDLGQNLVLNPGYETAPTFVAAQTAVNWIDGTAAGSASNNAFSWAIPTSGIVSSASCRFDTAQAHGGTESMNLSTLNGTGTLSVATYVGTAPTNLTGIVLYPSTTYIITGWINTSNVATSSAFIDVREFNSAFTNLATNSTNKLSGTNGWTQVTKTFTTNASTAWGGVLLRNNVAGNIGTAWFDDISLVAPSFPAGMAQIQVGAVVTPGVQNISGPKIWS